MSYIDITIPILGYSEGVGAENQPFATTGYMSNCRPRDVLERKIRLGQRPGLKKAYSQQIGGGANPVVVTKSVTVGDVAFTRVITEYIDFAETVTYESVFGTEWMAQTFTPGTTHTITKVSLYIINLSLAGGNINISIQGVDGNNKPDGNEIASGSIAKSSVPIDIAHWRVIALSSTGSLTASARYAIVVSCPSASEAQRIRWGTNATGGLEEGEGFSSSDSGSTWTAYSEDEFHFKEFGVAESAYSGAQYAKFLVSISNNEVWYESSAGTMEEITDANGDIDADLPLSVVEAFGKLFIANMTKLKVADFINVKINTADIGSNLPDIGTLLTGGTSSAKMSVDYIDASSGACNVYGYRVTEEQFASGETVTGTNDALDSVSFITSAAETAPPHWYDWTVYAGDTTNYGTMPTSASKIALYRGRIVINDDFIPNSWLMTKVGIPWKIKRDSTNDGDLSAVTHTNTLVGKIGDVVNSFISYKDDFLIFGCVNSIWVLVGDPLGAGQLARVTNTTGIFDENSWCIDDRGNLFFFGDNGIYKMPISESFQPPINISKGHLPNLTTDWDLDKTLHKVVLGFDPKVNGILICRTLIPDGTNLNYWYSLLTKGFYPETYPTSCGIFSALYYSATDDTYKKFLLGGNDGYLREFDNSTKNDVTTSSTSAIDSYFASIDKIGTNEDTESKLIWIGAVTAGGASGGDFSDSDDISWSVFTADDAETCLEDIKDGATAFTSGEFSGTGKQNKSRIRMRGIWAGIKLRNNTAGESWAINSLYGNIIPAGKKK